MKIVNSNIGTWVLSSMGAIAIALSIIVSLPTISKAATITVSCADGTTLTCTGHGCKGTDNNGCQCETPDGETDKKLCPVTPILD